MHDDTIAAIATPSGRGAVGIVRLSGPAAAAIAGRMVGTLPPPRFAALKSIRGPDGPLDRGLCTVFPAPRSYTGEDVVELQIHGGVALGRAVLAATLHHGARAANPGEFTERAFLNGKIDLLQAEAVADLINAATVRAAQSALRSLSGGLSRRVEPIARGLTALRVELEASLDFPDEELPDPGAALGPRIAALRDDVTALAARAESGRRLVGGLTLAIVGPPNVGKSSLLNRLLEDDRAIVTDVPGTTRDLVVGDLDLEGVPVHVIDTAGLRESDDPVEREGMRRTLRALAAVDVVVALTDVATDTATRASIDAQAREHAPAAQVLSVVNKIDLCPAPSRFPADALAVSARNGTGLEALEEAIAAVAGEQDLAESEFSARARHVAALKAAAGHLERALSPAAGAAAELLAADLAAAHRELAALTGEVTSDQLLGEIFSTFCIGK